MTNGAHGTSVLYSGADMTEFSTSIYLLSPYSLLAKWMRRGQQSASAMVPVGPFYIWAQVSAGTFFIGTVYEGKRGKQ